MDKIKQKQWMILAGVLALIISLVLLLITVSTPKKKSETQASIKFDYPIDPQQFEAQWQEKMTNLLKEQQDKANALEQALNQFNEHREKQVEIILQQEQQLKEVTSRLQQLEERPVVEVDSHDALAEAVSLEKFHIQHLSLTAKEQSPLPKTDMTYVPSGSFVEAILLGGLDAHTGVSAQSDPHPVLLRVLDNGVLPKNHNSQLNHCHIIAAGFGDISSERAYIRLERMSCEQNGIFTDYPVYGYVTGPDGKDGIRGKVVLRDKAVVSRAFLGGFLSGLSEVALRSVTTHSVSALGSVETVKGSDAALYSSSQGAGNAMELYARYNIKRAEQYQPVIEIPAGTKINVVFNRGFYLDGLSENDAGQLQASKHHADFLMNKQGASYEATDFTADE